ncbi:TIR domain-containing protein [Tateyamaria sp. SN3-11]|uniref:nSTAND1 domain-containing NTPase n=1 Tax=Tateyamaria sp. SN3-11 TaxID=3092147 RepID=UPI0039EABB7C
MTIFLSYSSQNYDQAVTLHNELTNSGFDGEVYFAPKRNHAGAFWMDRLQAKLECSSIVVLLIGDEVGYWQQIEYRAAVDLHSANQNLRILPIVLGNRAPGLPFLQQFHALMCDGKDVLTVVPNLLAAIEHDPQQGSPKSAWRATNPYRGLEAMEAQDAAFFFGREELTARVLSGIIEHPQKLITLVGNSGVGKSSVVFSGVYGALRACGWNDEQSTAPWPGALSHSNRWLTLSFSPGDAPLKSFVAACVQAYASSPAEVEAEVIRWLPLLSRKSGETGIGDLIEATKSELARLHRDSAPERIVLYMDQAEELYLRARPEEARLVARFLAEALPRDDLVVLASLRSDFYGALQADAHLFPLTHRIDVPPLDHAGITAMLMRPAEVLGVTFEQPLLISKIAEIAAQEEGALPMLSFLMREAWESMRNSDRNDPILRLPTDIVDISSPLTKQADRFIAEHPSSEPTLRDLFTLRLCHVPKGGRAVRRRARRAECPEAEWNLATKLAGERWRLLSMGEDIDGTPTVSVAHEALLSSWAKLAEWIDDRRDFLIWKGHLEEDRLAWEEAPERDRDSALLLGLNLAKARAYYEEHSSDLTKSDKEFIDASIAQDDAKLRAEKKRSTRLRQTGLVVAASLAVLCVNLAYQVGRANIAETETAIAEATAERAEVAAEVERRLRLERDTLFAQLQEEQEKTQLALEAEKLQTNIAAAKTAEAIQSREAAEVSEARAVKAKRETELALEEAKTALEKERLAKFETNEERILRREAQEATAAAEARAELWRALFEINETIVARRTRGDRSVAAFQDIAIEIDRFEEKVGTLGLNSFEEKVIFDQAANRTMEAFVDTRFNLRDPDEFRVFVVAAQESKADLVGLDVSTSSAEKLNLSKLLTAYVRTYWEHLNTNSSETVLAVLESSAALREHVLKLDPSNAECMCELTNTYSQLEMLYRSVGQNDVANQTLRKRLELARTVPASVRGIWDAHDDHYIDAILDSADFGILNPGEQAELLDTARQILSDSEKKDVSGNTVIRAILMIAEQQSRIDIGSDKFDRVLEAANDVAKTLPEGRTAAIPRFSERLASHTLTRFSQQRRPFIDLVDAIAIVETVGFNRASYMIASHVAQLNRRKQRAASMYKALIETVEDEKELLEESLLAQRTLLRGGHNVTLDGFLDALDASGRTEAASKLGNLQKQPVKEAPRIVRKETAAAQGKPFDFQADLTLDTLLYGVDGNQTPSETPDSAQRQQQSTQSPQTQTTPDGGSSAETGSDQTFQDALERFKFD